MEKRDVDIKKSTFAGDERGVKKVKFERELHFQKADVFNVKLLEAVERAKILTNKEYETVAISIDFQKNLLLPLTGIS